MPCFSIYCAFLLVVYWWCTVGSYSCLCGCLLFLLPKNARQEEVDRIYYGILTSDETFRMIVSRGVGRGMDKRIATGYLKNGVQLIYYKDCPERLL